MSPHDLELTFLTAHLLYRFITGRRLPGWIFAIEAAFFVKDLFERFHVDDLIWGGADTPSYNIHDHNRSPSRNRYPNHAHTHGGPERGPLAPREMGPGDIPTSNHSRSNAHVAPRRGQSATRDVPRWEEGRDFDTDEYFRRCARSNRGRSESRQTLYSKSDHKWDKRVHF